MAIGAGAFGVLCIFIAVLLVGVTMLASAVRIVPEYQRLVVFRLGRPLGAKGPGIVFLLPVLDAARPVDLREQEITPPPQTVLTHDEIQLSIRLDLYYKVIDPRASVENVANAGMATAGLAATILRAEVGGMRAIEAISQPEQLSLHIRDKLDETVRKWGLQVTNIEIREIVPPADVADALTRQVSQERVQRVLNPSLAGSKGTAQTMVYMNEGKVVIDGQPWDATSRAPIPSGSTVRVRRVILEVEQESDT